jgi:hypothetical protein
MTLLVCGVTPPIEIAFQSPAAHVNAELSFAWSMTKYPVVLMVLEYVCGDRRLAPRQTSTTIECFDVEVAVHVDVMTSPLVSAGTPAE